MIEPEIAFGDMNDCMDLAEDYIKFMVSYCLKNHKEDIEFFDSRVKKGLIDYLVSIRDSKFARISYDDACNILIKA